LLLAQKLGFTINDIKQLNINSINASFMKDSDKELIKGRFEREWKEIEK
jgi:adenosine deaminase